MGGIKGSRVWLAGKHKRCSSSLPVSQLLLNIHHDSLHPDQVHSTSIVTMTQLQAAMMTIIGVFHKNAGQDKVLNKTELKTLLETEFQGLLGNAKDKNVIDELFKGLDRDGDGSVDFTEFVTMVAALSVAINGMC
ncbi:protein S100-A1-like [Alosa pseudoharengus]|uniref:protein S100-A1-like n=1 Tax=Alosa pseudoharengus TaxID=34774 RepID=UPI003F8C783E